MSTTRVPSTGERAGAGAQVGEAGLLGAVEDPGAEREALSKLGQEDARVLGVADGAGGDRASPRRAASGS